MSAAEAKVRCPKCHFRFFVPFDEIGRDHTTPCPNCATSIPVKTAPAKVADVANAQQAVTPPPREAAVAEPAAAPIADLAANPAPRPWWKFWAR